MDELNEWLMEGVLAAPILEGVKGILDADIHEDEMADRMREYWSEAVTNIEQASVVGALLQASGIISPYFFRKLLNWRGV